MLTLNKTTDYLGCAELPCVRCQQVNIELETLPASHYGKEVMHKNINCARVLEPAAQSVKRKAAFQKEELKIVNLKIGF